MKRYFDTRPVFTHADVVAHHVATGASERTANNLLAHHVRAGHVVRVRRGLYATVPRGADPERFVPDPYLLASNLSDDAVVAYHAALEFHGRAYSMWFRFHYLTANRARPVRFRGLEFVPVVAPARVRALPNFGGGVMQRPYAGGTVRVTTLERALVDVLYAPYRSGGWEEVWRSLESIEFFDIAAVVRYAKTLGSAITIARVGYFLDQHREQLMVEDTHLEALRALVPTRPQYFDPARAPGKVVPEWSLIVPPAVIERAWEEPLDVD